MSLLNGDANALDFVVVEQVDRLYQRSVVFLVVTKFLILI